MTFKGVGNVLLLSIVLLQGCGKESNTIKIGAVLELTGNVSAYGKAAQNGIAMAVNELNENHYFGDKKLRVLFEDNASSPRLAATAIQRLISDDKVSVVIGSISSGCTLAMAPIAERNHVVLFSPGASSPLLTNAGDYIFRNYPSDVVEADVMANFLFSKGVRKVGVIYSNDDYGFGLAATFEKKWKEICGPVTFSDGYAPGTTDFRSIIGKIDPKTAQVLYLPGYYQSVGLLVRQIREGGPAIRFVTSTGIEDPAFFFIAKNAGDGAIYPTPSIDFQNPPEEALQFIHDYEKTFNEKPNYPALLSYDAMKIIAYAVKNGGTHADSIKAQLYGIRNFPGTTGSTTIDSNGDAQKPFWFKMPKDGNFILVDTSSVRFVK